MKQASLLAMTLVLTAAALAGCGCTNQRAQSTSAPTVLPTNEENWTTESTAAQPTTAATHSGAEATTAAAETTKAAAETTKSTTEAASGTATTEAQSTAASTGAAGESTAESGRD